MGTRSKRDARPWWNWLAWCALVPLVFACTRTSLPVRVTRAESDADEAWIVLAEHDSRTLLHDQCNDLAPRRLAPDDPMLVRCARRVAVVIEAESRRRKEQALAECVASGGAQRCCLGLLPSRETARAQGECDARCAAAVGHELGEDRYCGLDVPAEGDVRSRLDVPVETPALLDVLAGCTPDLASVEETCRSLPTRPERRTCARECASRIEKAQVEVEAEACARRALEFLTVRCDAPPIGYRDFSRERCEDWCRAKLSELKARR